MKKILIVEDEPTLQRAILSVLTDQGYKIFSATNGEDAITIARKELPDLILLDLILPKKDGFAVLTDLKQEPATMNIPVIILTNLEGNADVERALALGATTYLVKTNYKLEEIAEKIKSILGTAHS
ncbi:MAG: response regulator [Patescibacteria group bacterium]